MNFSYEKCNETRRKFQTLPSACFDLLAQYAGLFFASPKCSIQSSFSFSAKILVYVIFNVANNSAVSIRLSIVNNRNGYFFLRTEIMTSSQLACQLRVSLNCFHCCLSSVHYCEDRFHIHFLIRNSHMTLIYSQSLIHYFMGLLLSQNNHQLPAGLLALLIEHCTGVAQVMGSNPVQAQQKSKKFSVVQLVLVWKRINRF